MYVKIGFFLFLNLLNSLENQVQTKIRSIH